MTPTIYLGPPGTGKTTTLLGTSPTIQIIAAVCRALWRWQYPTQGVGL
jgi:hypothetical protein